MNSKGKNSFSHKLKLFLAAKLYITKSINQKLGFMKCIE